MLGPRIKQARKAAGLSLRALAERTGVSAMAISKYETGKSIPSSTVLLALAKALGVRTEYFFRSKAVVLGEVEYRKRSRLPKKLQAQIEGDLMDQVERFLEATDYLPGGTPLHPFALPQGLPERILLYDQLETVAETVRDAWTLGLDPIPDLTELLEERGIRVFQSDALHDATFDGLAAQVDGMPVIVVGRGWPGDRQRFTLAHELGHLLLQERLDGNLDEERAANRFAGAFLVPQAQVFAQLGPKRTWLEPQELCVLKTAYGLSMQGWIHRAKDLGILAESRYNQVMQFFRTRGWHRNEPCEDLPREEPRLFQRLVFHALAEDLISESKAAELLRLPLGKFRALRSLSRAPNAADQ
jgi:Zn-dependent peptidase ImmA (M78 family)/DNA-binding XRE family transcriptional regulator